MAKKNRDYIKQAEQVTLRNRGEDRYNPEGFGNYDYQYGLEHPIRRREVQRRYKVIQELEQRRSERSYDRIAQEENEFYAGVDPRRRIELADAGLIQEDPNAMANLPRMAQHHQFPKSAFDTTPYLDDSERY